MKLLLTAVLVMVGWTTANAIGWRGIVPLKSQRSDVERLLGPPSGECKCFYDAGNETVKIRYAQAPCVDIYLPGWNVPTDTVLTISVSSENPKKFSDLKLTTSDFQKAGDDTFRTYYSNRAEGVEYTVTSEGFADSIAYIPSNKDSHLRCPCYPLLDESVQRSTKWDVFGFRTTNYMFARLDNFIIQLQNVDYWTGFILLYSGKKTTRKQMSLYKKSILRHVIETRGMSAHRIKLIDAGYRDDPEIELFLLPPDYSPPEPRATWAPCRKR